jgi:hypothetical protein
MDGTESYLWLIGGAVGVAGFLGVVIAGNWLMRRTGSMPERSSHPLPLVKTRLVKPMREAEPVIPRRSTSIAGWFLFLTAATVGAAMVFFAAVHALLTSGAI